MEASGRSKASRPERSDPSASGAKPRCSTWTARAACWTSSSLRSRSSAPGLHELERPRLLLQIRPHCCEVRADRGPGPGQIPGERKAGETPEFKDWREEWEGEVGSGLYIEDLEQVRRELLAEGHCPRWSCGA